jgi:glycosyltransferase involved in cell wall biosynthesis
MPPLSTDSARRHLRLLAINNSYPPSARGGYGEICADVMSGLARRGHNVTILTCRERLDSSQATAEDRIDGVKVRRELDYVLAPWRRPIAGLRAVSHDTKIMREALAEGVDVVFAWHCRGIVKTSLRMAHEAGVPVLYQLHDRWVLYERPGSLYLPWSRLDRLGAGLPRELIGRIAAPRLELRAPRIERDGIACFVSEWLEREHTRRGWRPRRREIVRCGVDIDAFARPTPPAQPPHRLLFAGRLEPRKGLDIAVRALAASDAGLTLTVAGLVDDPAYVERVRTLAAELGVADRVSWLGEVPRTRVRDLLRDHDLLVFPSIGVEAYALGLLEALAAGTLVVTSAPGGPREYLRHEVNALLFEPGDVAGLVAALTRLREEDGLAARLLEGARRTAEEISLDAIVDQVDTLLEQAVRAA